ncbi:MAG TPA: PAS domain S-box protein [Methanomicrobiales archaeon]|jgi:PAS domain S-box-containing protein|nr:PAS domain S-box protein [Methanomicrobiales archaeon]
MISLLLVDDEEELLDLARHFVGRAEGIELSTSLSAPEALGMHRAHPFDAIVCDLNMPDIGGIEFLKMLRDEGDTTPFIILTGKGSEQGAMEALNLGADFYFAKGGDPENLFAELARIVVFTVKNQRIEKALRESEQRYRAIFEITGSATAVLDESGTIVLVNDEVEPILGYLPAELEGRVHWSRFVPPDELPRMNEYWRLLHEDPSRASQRLEARLVDRHGRIRAGIISAKLIPGTRNTVISIADITELRYTDGKLRASENLYRTIFRTTGTATAILDGSGTIILANGEVEPLFGFPPQELEGRMALADFIPPAELPRFSEYFRLLHEDPASATQHYEARLVDRWGGVKHGIFSVALIPGSRDSVISIMDISGLKRAEEALRESEEKYRTLVENASDGILVIQDEIIRFSNSRAAEIWGGARGENIGKRFVDLLDPGEVGRVTEIHRARLAGRITPRVYDTIIHRKDGTPVHLAINAGIITYLGAPATLAFIRDITERKKGEEALLTAHRKLNLLSSITRHDIRNQLMVILGYTELLRQEARPDQATRIITSVEEAARAIQHHIEFTKEYQEVGIHAPAWQDLREVIVLAGGRCSLGRVRLAIGVEGVELFADPLLERAVYNLIDNALRHGGPLTMIRFSATESAAGLTFTCEDDGAGIPAADRERIFSPGFSKASGYGLFLVREILGITGISIHETGEPGKGARFTMVVPRGSYRIAR